MVERWIQRVAEPRKLFLAWQAHVRSKERHRWAVGALEPQGNQSGVTLGYFRAGSEFERFNPGHTYEELVALGYQGYPGFSLREDFHERGVAEALMRRLPPRSRPDFPEYMKQFRLTPGLKLSDFSLLGRTEARVPGDGFSVVDPLNPNETDCDLFLEIAGFRHYIGNNGVEVKLHDLVEIVTEPGNPFDCNAVQFKVRGQKIGNVNRLQAPAFLRWLETCRVSGVTERLNGKVDRPRAFVFVTIRPRLARVAA